MRMFTIFTPAKCLWDYKVKEDEMGGAFGTYGRREKCIVFWRENPKEGDNLKDMVGG
jgi:hypothetical protein